MREGVVAHVSLALGRERQNFCARTTEFMMNVIQTVVIPNTQNEALPSLQSLQLSVLLSCIEQNALIT